jgi:hypothetical protein
MYQTFGPTTGFMYWDLRPFFISAWLKLVIGGKTAKVWLLITGGGRGLVAAGFGSVGILIFPFHRGRCDRRCRKPAKAF